MTEKDTNSSSLSIREQAIDWFLRLESNEATVSDRHRFETWLNEDSLHREEYEQVARVWNDFHQVKPAWAEARRHQEAKQKVTTGIEHASNPPRPSLIGWGTLAPAAAVVVAVCMFTFWWTWDVSAPIQQYHTVKGEQRTLHLADGSTVVMNTHSLLTVPLSEQERVLNLQQGEALFSVSHDEERPFTVLARNGHIRDIGTEFLVRTFPEHVHVSVLEGIVEVGMSNSEGFRSRTSRVQRLVQGEQVEYTTAGHLTSIEAFDAQTAIAWTKRQLVFDNQPLEEVLNEWARYRTEELRLLDANLRSLPVNGKFHVDNIESFFQALEDVLSIQAYRVNPELVVLERKASS